MSVPRLSPGRQIWGDGFAEDDLRCMAGVDRWDRLSADEYTRFFPRLVADGGMMPEVLREHLKNGLAVRALRLRRRSGRDEALMSVSAGEVRLLGVLHHESWFGPRSRAGRLTGWLLGKVASGNERSEAVALLDEILETDRAGRRPRFETDHAVRFSFYSGVHAAYIWPEAAVLHELFTAAGWLGHVARGRAAIMPSDVAAYFHEILRGKGPKVTLAEPRLACCFDGPRSMELIVRAAGKRLRGSTSPVTRALSLQLA